MGDYDSAGWQAMARLVSPADQRGDLPLSPGQRVGGLDRLLQITREAFRAGGWPGHIQAPRLGGRLPGQGPCLPEIAVGTGTSEPEGGRDGQPGSRGRVSVGLLAPPMIGTAARRHR